MSSEDSRLRSFSRAGGRNQPLPQFYLRPAPLLTSSFSTSSSPHYHSDIRSSISNASHPQTHSNFLRLFNSSIAMARVSSQTIPRLRVLPRSPSPTNTSDSSYPPPHLMTSLRHLSNTFQTKQTARKSTGGKGEFSIIPLKEETKLTQNRPTEAASVPSLND